MSPRPGTWAWPASTDDISAAMDRLVNRQDATEAELARRHLAAAVNPAPTALPGLSSCGTCAPSIASPGILKS
jgi:hypothetical protein